ncbi:ATP-binding protein [Helicobacter pylori CPY1962]|nr:ATP-binding protein [Helicobacter pylori CPY1962]
MEIKGKNGADMEFCLPKVYPFPPKSLYIEHEKDGQFLREMLMHLLSSTPLVQLEVILVDALSLGAFSIWCDGFWTKTTILFTSKGF